MADDPTTLCLSVTSGLYNAGESGLRESSPAKVPKQTWAVQRSSMRSSRTVRAGGRTVGPGPAGTPKRRPKRPEPTSKKPQSVAAKNRNPSTGSWTTQNAVSQRRSTSRGCGAALGSGMTGSGRCLGVRRAGDAMRDRGLSTSVGGAPLKRG